MRETCIWETPTRAAISRCRRSSSKRRRSTSRSRSLREAAASCSTRMLSSARSSASSPAPIRSPSVGGAVLLVDVQRPVERVAAIGERRLARLHDLLVRQPGRRGHLRRGRAAPELGGERLAHALDRRRRVAHVARDADRPRAVAEVAPELAEDGRHGEGAERRAALGVEAVDRIHEADARHLLEILERLARARVPAREHEGEAHVALDEPVARLVVALGRAPPQRAFVLATLRGTAADRRHASHGGSSIRRPEATMRDAISI